ncbi:putative outer membrane protein [Salmonella enterica subsp. enterica serovar Senftenberg str. A4-543]|nr:putative outer membrane protein [Salmonella enterica subsp. enterica serovar Senftenberg str. A4-543]
MDNNQQVSGKMMNVTLTLTPVLNDNQFTHSTDTVMLESNLQWEVLTK